MNIDDLTLGQVKQIQGFGNTQRLALDHPYKIGENYLIRTVTFVQVGKLVAVYDQELVLDQAAWIADTGRFHDALKNGIETLPSAEIEPFLKEVIIGRGALVDGTIYSHKLPQEQK